MYFLENDHFPSFEEIQKDPYHFITQPYIY